MKSPKSILSLAIILFIISIGSIGLLVNIFEKKQEAKEPFFKVVEINDQITDPAVWGRNFPQQYEDYLKTVDQVRTRYGGSEAFPRTPSKSDPRSIVAQSKLEEDTRLKKMWAGYGFSKDFREDRGHAFMLIDQLYTKRQNSPQPGTCINCHASTVEAMKRLGEGDLEKGFHAINKMPYSDAKKHFSHPVACIDCHNPSTMELRITRPAFVKGISEYKKSIGIKNFNVHKDSTRQEMRTFVCAQCHVEYYFKGENKELVYPWSNGIKGDQILTYYVQEAFKDWTHKDTKSELLKAQHPEFELWSQGIHARSGVSCTDCHMPFKRVGAHKITDHHVRSPLLMVNRACQTCHHNSEKELTQRVYDIQERHNEMRNMALDALIELIEQMEKYPAKDSKEYSLAQEFHKKAQFLIDFVEAENSIGFHAPQEAARLLAKAIDYIRKGQSNLKARL